MPALIPILLSLSVLLGAGAHGQGAASAVASCTIVTPIQVQNESPLAFGSLSVSPMSGGTVMIRPSGERSYEGGVILQAGTWGAARFRVSGEDGASFMVTLPENCALKRTHGAEELLADGFVCSPGVRANLTGGAQSISVGATLHVSPGQPVGAYAGTFDVTVAYQ